MKVIAPLFQTFALAALASCAAPSPPGRKDLSGQSDSPLSGRVFQDVNAYRRSHGAKELQRRPGLARLARQHCEYLRKNRSTFDLYGKNVSHDGAEGRSLVMTDGSSLLPGRIHPPKSTRAAALLGLHVRLRQNGLISSDRIRAVCCEKSPDLRKRPNI